MQKVCLISILYLIILSSFGCKTNQDQSKLVKTSERQPPNIILIMADDMGFSDLGILGGEISTPNIDGLGEKGMIFSQFYNNARCCPTRASLITGLYPHQTGIGHMTNLSENYNAHDLNLPAYRGNLNQKTMTIAEMLKGENYATYMTGKWHLGMEERDQWPLQRGFDRFYGILDGATNFFKPVYPRGITLNNDTISVTDEDYYTTDAFTDYAIKFINEGQEVKKEQQQPFFLYLAFNAPHWPLQAPQQTIDKYKGKYGNGWQHLRKNRFNRMQEMGILSPDWKLSPQDSPDWDELSEEQKEEMDLRMAIYAAQVDRMDQNIGKLVTYLTNNDLMENTIIMFLMDNGACAEGGELGWGDKEQLETKEGYILSYGQSWANASNTPFRKYKHWLHEGGISTPLIIHWPDGIKKVNEGKFTEQYGFLPDIMATIKDVSKADYPKQKNGKALPALSGNSLLPIIKGIDEPIHTEPIFWEHEGNKAVRLGRYKLVMEWKGELESVWELYDMEKDRSELNNLADQLPAKADKMSKMWQTWAEENQVQPWNRIEDLMR
jgi:arylsulfatase